RRGLGGVALWKQDARNVWGSTGRFVPGRGSELALRPDGKEVAVASGTQVALWQWGEESAARRFGAPAWVNQIGLSPDGKWLAASYDAPPSAPGAEGTPSIQVWEVATRKALPILTPRLHYVTALRFSPDSQVLACACL